MSAKQLPKHYTSTTTRGRAAAARLAHNQKVGGSSPPPATKRNLEPSLRAVFNFSLFSGGSSQGSVMSLLPETARRTDSCALPSPSSTCRCLHRESSVAVPLAVLLETAYTVGYQSLGNCSTCCNNSLFESSFLELSRHSPGPASPEPALTDLIHFK